MRDDNDIPILTDLIEEKIDITEPEFGHDSGHDLVISEDDEPELSFDPEHLELEGKAEAVARIGSHPELEQLIRRILDEHLELAWQEIRLAIEVSLNDNNKNS